LLAAGAGATVLAAQAQAQPKQRFIKGICSSYFPRTMDVFRKIEATRNAGFDAIEIAAGRDVAMDASDDELRRIVDTAERHRVAIASLWASGAFEKTPLNSPDANVRAQGVAGLKRVAAMAKTVGAGAILMVPCRVDPRPPYQAGYEETWQRVSASLPAAIPAAEQARVVLTMENVWNKFLLSPVEMRTFVDQFRSPWLQAHFDAGNVMQWGYPQDWIRTLGPRIRRVHIKDFKLARGAESGRFVKFFDGDVDFQAVMQALKEAGYSGSVTAEVSREPDDPDGLGVSKAMDRILAMA
jgi:hexulose-6-phosphate isomerase